MFLLSAIFTKKEIREKGIEERPSEKEVREDRKGKRDITFKSGKGDESRELCFQASDGDRIYQQIQKSFFSYFSQNKYSFEKFLEFVYWNSSLSLSGLLFPFHLNY